MKLVSRTLGGRLKEARLNKGMSQVYVADHIGMVQSVVNRYESDGVKAPKRQHLEAFAELYGVTIEELTANPYSLDHIPEELMEMLYDKRSLPYLAEAWVRFQEMKIEEAKKNLRNV